MQDGLNKFDGLNMKLHQQYNVSTPKGQTVTVDSHFVSRITAPLLATSLYMEKNGSNSTARCKQTESCLK